MILKSLDFLSGKPPSSISGGGSHIQLLSGQTGILNKSVYTGSIDKYWLTDSSSSYLIFPSAPAANARIKTLENTQSAKIEYMEVMYFDGESLKSLTGTGSLKA